MQVFRREHLFSGLKTGVFFRYILESPLYIYMAKIRKRRNQRKIPTPKTEVGKDFLRDFFFRKQKLKISLENF